MTELKYKFSHEDDVIVSATCQLIDKLTQSKTLNPGQRISVAKAQYVLSRLPRFTEDLDLSVHITGPRRIFGEVETYHWWTVAIEGPQICVTGGGHFYRPSTGGDSFSTFRWATAPGCHSEYLDNLHTLAIVPDIAPFDVITDQIDFTKEKYEVEVTDAGNKFLANDDEDEASEDADDEDTPTLPLQVHPLDEADRSLAMMIDVAAVNQLPAEYAYGVERCDFCKRPESDFGLMVDGNVLGGGGSWANMCSKCFELKGEGIGWGKGQLYARQPTGSWRLVSGFQGE